MTGPSGRHRPEGRGLILLLAWAAAGAAVIAILTRGAPLSEPAPGPPAELRRPCSLGYVPYGNDEGDVVCVRTTPLGPRSTP